MVKVADINLIQVYIWMPRDDSTDNYIMLLVFINSINLDSHSAVLQIHKPFVLYMIDDFVFIGRHLLQLTQLDNIHNYSLLSNYLKAENYFLQFYFRLWLKHQSQSVLNQVDIQGLLCYLKGNMHLYEREFEVLIRRKIIKLIKKIS